MNNRATFSLTLLALLSLFSALSANAAISNCVRMEGAADVEMKHPGLFGFERGHIDLNKDGTVVVSTGETFYGYTGYSPRGSMGPEAIMAYIPFNRIEWDAYFYGERAVDRLGKAYRKLFPLKAENQGMQQEQQGQLQVGSAPCVGSDEELSQKDRLKACLSVIKRSRSNVESIITELEKNPNADSMRIAQCAMTRLNQGINELSSKL